MDLREASRRRTLLGGFIACALAPATLLLPRGVAQQSRGRFSEDEVVQALRAHVPPKRITTLARQYGIAFQLTPESEARLRNAGADDELLDALRALAPAPSHPTGAGPLLIKSNPAGAQVFLDGKLAGTTDADGELELPELLPGQHKIRLTLAGYRDFEQTRDLLAGQRDSSPVTLEKYVVPPPPVAKFTVKLVKKCSGELTIGNGSVQFRPDCDAKDASFEFPLSEITECGSHYQRSMLAQRAILDGFYLRPRDGKDRDFRSSSTLVTAILQLLKRYGCPGL